MSIPMVVTARTEDLRGMMMLLLQTTPAHSESPQGRERGRSIPFASLSTWVCISGIGGEADPPAVQGRKRCRMHGGAPGSGAPSGERNGNYRHGFFAAEALAERKATRAW